MHFITNMRVQTFILVTHFTPKIKLITFLNEWVNLTSEIESHFTTHKTEGVRMILTLSWHEENIINAILLYKTLNYKKHTTLAIYYSEVWHSTNSAMPLKQSSLLVSRSQHISTCLSLHSLAVCDWSHMSTVFAMIKFSCPFCI